MSLNADSVLKHIAIIMDGNGRWAKSRFMPRIFGHRSSISQVDSSIEYCVENDIKILTLFAFGRDNWVRPKDEVDGLMDLFYKTLDSKSSKLNKNNVKLKVIGDRARLSTKLLEKIVEVESLTNDNSGLELRLAIDYAGCWDILQAVKNIVKEYVHDIAKIDDLSEQDFEKHLVSRGLPIDLLIRTSGEVRLSDFMLWHIAYAEMYFTDIMWPDFSKKELQKAVDCFYSRQRRFGKI